MIKITKFTQGIKAAKAGVAITDCPYAKGYARSEWIKGFNLMSQAA